MADFDKELFKELGIFGDELLLDIDKSLKNKGHGSKAVGNIQSARIIGSGEFKIATNNDGITMQFYLNDYWYQLEYGRGPTKASKSKKPFNKTLAGAIYEKGWDVGKGINAQDWYRRSQLKLYKDSNGKKGSLKAKNHKIYNNYQGLRKMLAYAIASAIHKKGTIKRFGYQGSGFLSDVLNDGRFDILSEKISKIIGNKIVIDISQAIAK